MKKIYLTLCITFLSISLFGQQTQVDDVLKQIEKNNTTLKMEYEASEAERLSASTDRFLSNPEVEFAYMWGSPTTSGNRIDASIKQSFDFPSVYTQKRHIARIDGQKAELSYQGARVELMIQARTMCVELTYLNAMCQELTVRRTQAAELLSSYEKMLREGSTSAIQTTKAKMSLVQIENKLATTSADRDALLGELKLLNGGQTIEFTQTTYQNVDMPVDFEKWFDMVAEKNPAMEYLKKQTEVAQHSIKLATAQGLPSFAVGYKTEAVGAGEQFQGVMASVSIPLWENKNRIKAAKATLRATQSQAVDAKLQFYEELRNDYRKAAALREINNRYGGADDVKRNVDLLNKALSAGEISLLDYLVEIGTTYELIDQNLINERDLQLLVCKFLVYNS